MVTKGMSVVVVRGIKVPRGTTGVVIWAGETKYGGRVGLKDAGGAVHFTAMGNVEPVAQPSYPTAAAAGEYGPAVAAAVASPAVTGAIAATAAMADPLAALTARVAALEAALAALTAVGAPLPAQVALPLAA